ncbi:PEP/pyruvate-binding domain-containing protein [Kribbella sp. CA-245084]|uniref:PEP/pyruvate-binding domain-containing protein n=1 Tax=Kribbella sp. CA-245084 TaxID=3239940 RepID=UPI003D8E2EB3
MLVPLAEATADQHGGKAAGLAALIRAGLPIPAGVVVPADALLNAPTDAVVDRAVVPRGAVADELGEWLERMGDPLVAVRSSAANEDTAHTSAAGQHDSFLGVRGLAAVLDAIQACRASVWSPRAVAYRNGSEAPPMAVIVQLQLDSDVSGVMFTTDGTTTIEASWGLGPSVVEGRVTPDRYEVADGRVTRTIADKQTTLTLTGTHQVPTTRRGIPTLSDATAVHLAILAHQAATALGTPQDLEWAIAANTPWLLQSRPITAQPPPTPTSPPTPATRTPAPPTGTPGTLTVTVTAGTGTAGTGTGTAGTGTAGTGTGTAGTGTGSAGTGSAGTGSAGTGGAGTGSAGTGTAGTLTGIPGTLTGIPGTLTGTPGSHGTAAGPARVVRGAADFPQVRAGDILVCPFTDPAWTPLLSIAAGVITEQGGVLSHAAIIARERGIPAVLAVPDATTQIPDDTPLTINGTTGTIHL